jgi:endonuclease III
MRDLPALLDQLEQADGRADPVPSADGWELVLAENVAYLGIGQPGQDRIDLFTGSRAVLAPDANALRVLTRLGYATTASSYAASYRQAQAAASAQLPATVTALQRAHQLLRRHGQLVCRRRDPACHACALAADCPSAGHPAPLY